MVDTSREKKQVRISKNYIQNMEIKRRDDGYGKGLVFMERYGHGGYPGRETIFYTKVLSIGERVIRTVICIAGVSWDFTLYATDGAMSVKEIRNKIFEVVMDDEECLFFLNQNHPYFNFTFYKKKQDGIQQ